MSAQILDGKRLANTIICGVREKIEQRLAAGLRRPGLAVVIVGADQASHIYVRNKRRSCERAGILSRDYDLPGETSESDLMSLIDELNNDVEIDGILVQLPLPNHIRESEITNHISPLKDADGFHAENVGRLALRQPGLRPCTPKGIMAMLNDAGINPKGYHAVVVGASNIVGRPMVLELLLRGATVTCCHKFTQGLQQHVEFADILVVAIGKPGVIDSNWIKPGAVVIDVGINRNSEGSLCGDVEFETAKQRAKLISPVPGGVGPMTVAELMENTLLAAEMRDHREQNSLI